MIITYQKLLQTPPIEIKHFTIHIAEDDVEVVYPTDFFLQVCLKHFLFIGIGHFQTSDGLSSHFVNEELYRTTGLDVEERSLQSLRLAITEVNGSWGKTDKGWINLKYVRYN